MRPSECPACGQALGARVRWQLLLRDAVNCSACGARLAVRTLWSQSWRGLGLLLMVAPVAMRQRYLPEVPAFSFTIWVPLVWMLSTVAVAMGRLDIAPVQRPLRPLEVMKLGTLLFLIVASLLAGLAVLSWIAG